MTTRFPKSRYDGAIDRAETGDAVTLTFADEIDVTRGEGGAEWWSGQRSLASPARGR